MFDRQSDLTIHLISVSGYKNLTSLRSPMYCKALAHMRLWLVLLLSATVLTRCVECFDPEIKLNRFDNPPKGLVYLEDSSIVFFHDEKTGYVSRSSDHGATWQPVRFEGKKNNIPVAIVVEHPYEEKIVYALSSTGTHFWSNDRGESWNKFSAPCQALLGPKPLGFNSADHQKIILNVEQCPGKLKPGSFGCKEIIYYTIDGFKSNPKVLVEEPGPCYWAYANKAFEKSDLSDSTAICLLDTPDGLQLAVSDDYFKTKNFVKVEGREYDSIINFGSVSKFFVAAVALDSSDDSVGLVVSTDLKTWEFAQFPKDGALKQSSYTILESSSHSLHVDVRSGSTLEDWVSGTFYTSNSDGTVFTKSLEHTDRSLSGLVDIEQVEHIEGVLIANVFEDMRVRSKISYNDGRTWSYVPVDENCPGDVSCGLNLHSVSDQRAIGRIFNSPAPGLFAGIGNTGTSLGDYDNGDLFVSENSGASWKQSKGASHIYLFGDHGNLFISVPDNRATSEIKYSLDRGETWQTTKLDREYVITFAMTSPKSSTMKFVLLGYKPNTFDAETTVIYVDFSSLYSRKCDMKEDGSGDFEKWYARYDESGEPNCVMGYKQYFWRKKKGAECYIGDTYHDELSKKEICLCTVNDYECDTGFDIVRHADNSFECVPGPLLSKDLISNCEPGSTYIRDRGYRLVPGNSCDKSKAASVVLDDKISEVCGSESFTGSGNITSVMYEFDGVLVEYIYLKNQAEFPEDETVFVRTSTGSIYVSHDQGTTWATILDDQKIYRIITNKYSPNVVYFLGDEKLHYSTDRAKTFTTVTLPSKLGDNLLGVGLYFNPVHPEWIIVDGEDCGLSNCPRVSYYSQDYGHSWNLLVERVDYCTWLNEITNSTQEQRVLCVQPYEKDGKSSLRLLSSSDFFQTQEVVLDKIVGLAMEHNFIVVAAIKDNDDLKAMVSVDGETFAEAKFPYNFHVDHQRAYTVLESSTGAVFMHVTVNSEPGTEYGALLKSNSNGTDYVMSLENVSRNSLGFVDFEKMHGLEGVAFANVAKVVPGKNQGNKKLYKSMITHNDGAEWSYISPPKKDKDGNDICSNQDISTCSLHLHGYTERDDYRDGYSSPSAVGLAVAIGNTGEFLTEKSNGNVYLTRDAGITWKEVQKGAYHSQFGDSGSIVALVKSGDVTNVLLYSLDEGESWKKYKFSEKPMTVVDISTVQSETSRKFLLWTSTGGKEQVIQVDFTNFAQRKCVLDSGHPDQDDFELWSPKHPLLEDDCLFGHRALYHRKIAGRDCYIGANIASPHLVENNCTCTRRDYECDFNYNLVSDGTCQLVPGFSPPDHMQVCSEMPGTVEYWEPTGYRRIPLTTCDGGFEYDKLVSHPCPGMEDSYRRKHQGLSGFGMFIAIFLPLLMAGILGYVIYDHYSKRYGQIRLGEEDAYKNQPLLIQYGIIAIAAVVTSVRFLPDALRHFVSVVKDRLSGQRDFSYTSREAFSRPTESYLPVDPDEDRELFMDDEDEEDAQEL